MMEGNSKDMQNHSFKLIGAEAGSNSSSGDDFQRCSGDDSWGSTSYCRPGYVALNSPLAGQQIDLHFERILHNVISYRRESNLNC
jgi:hypothetical protein